MLCTIHKVRTQSNFNWQLTNTDQETTYGLSNNYCVEIRRIRITWAGFLIFMTSCRFKVIFDTLWLVVSTIANKDEPRFGVTNTLKPFLDWQVVPESLLAQVCTAHQATLSLP